MMPSLIPDVTASYEKALIHPLEVAQNSFTRIALGVPKSSPASVLQEESNIPPLSIRRRHLPLRYVLKIKKIARAAIDVLPIPNIYHNYIGPNERAHRVTNSLMG